MKKLTFLFLLILTTTRIIYCYNAEITLTTNCQVGENIRLVARPEFEKDTIWIDFGDGKLIPYKSGLIIGTLKAQTITLYCNNLWSLDISPPSSFNSLIFNENCSLKSLNIHSTSITKLDLNNIADLVSLNIENTRLDTLDISKFNLRWLYCKNSRLKKLDVSHCTKLYWLVCSNNTIDTLILNQQPDLYYLDCHSNDITHFELTQNDIRGITLCGWNRLKFSTLPDTTTDSSRYDYYFQKAVPINDLTTVEETIDLSSEYFVNNSYTNYTWKTKSGNTLIRNIDYSISYGKTVFLKAQNESVYCEMTNAEFPDLTLKTTLTKIKDVNITPDIIAISSNEAGSNFTFSIATEKNNNELKVDFGNGLYENYTVGPTLKLITGTLGASKTVKIFCEGINAFYCYKQNLTSLDISTCEKLKHLVCYKNNLYYLNVNNNPDLSYLNFSNNNISSVNLINNNKLTRLDCSFNQLLSLSVYSSYLSTLYCQNNNISTLSTSNNNTLPLITYSKNNTIQNLICNNNQLSFSKLPFPKDISGTFIYAPQQKLRIRKTASVIDLSNEFSIGDCETNYIWQTLDGYILKEEYDFKMEKGITTFLRLQKNSVYCELTNKNFPDITGCNALKTTNCIIEILEKTQPAEISGFKIQKDFTNNRLPVKENRISVYSSLNTIYIHTPEWAELYIYDLNGTLIFAKQIVEGINESYIQNPGIYIVRVKVKGKNEVTSQKVVIN